MAQRTTFELQPRGGGDAWDNGPGGAVLSADFFGAQSGGALTASLSFTEASDTLSAASTADLSISSSVTEFGDTLAATALAEVTAQVAWLQFQAPAEAQLSLSITESGDTLAAAALADVAASASQTEANDTLSALGSAALVVSASQTEANDTLSASLTLSAASAQVTWLQFSAQSVLIANIAEANDTLIASITTPGTLVINASIAEAGDALSAALTAGGTSTAQVTWLQFNPYAPSAVDPQVAGSWTPAMLSRWWALDNTQSALTASASITEQGDALTAELVIGSTLDLNAAILEASDTLASTLSTATGGGGATAEEIWNYVLSNGLTAGETLAQALAAARTCCG